MVDILTFAKFCAGVNVVMDTTDLVQSFHIDYTKSSCFSLAVTVLYKSGCEFGLHFSPTT